MKLFEVVFSFLSPYKVVGSISANSPDEAKEIIRSQILENNPEIGEITFESVEEMGDSPLILSEPQGTA